MGPAGQAGEDGPGGHHHVIVQDNSEQDESIPLDRLFIRQRAVVCRATTCFWTNQGVAKFSGQSAKRQPYEVRHLQLALERGVEGVATIKGHCRITSVGELRSGLELSQRTRHRFRPDGFDSLEGFNRRSSSHAPPSKRRRLRSTKSSTRSNSDESSASVANKKMLMTTASCLHRHRPLWTCAQRFWQRQRTSRSPSGCHTRAPVAV